MSADAPNSTLYVRNINEKVKEDVVMTKFKMLFSQYGKVESIKVGKSLSARGQAWVTFESPQAAANALRGKNGFNFYGKELELQFSRPRDPSSKSTGKRKPNTEEEDLDKEDHQDRQRTKQTSGSNEEE